MKAEQFSLVWEKIHAPEKEAARLRPLPPRADTRVVKQSSREKFLLESSDWPFLISTWTARDSAVNRAAEHFERARTLLDWIKSGAPLSPDQRQLLEIWEEEDQLFSEVVIPDGRII